MRKLFLTLLFLLFVSSIAIFAQKANLKGSVVDTTDRKNLQNSVVSLLRKDDSVLVRFSRVDQSGKFVLTNVEPGNYLLMITHPYVGDYFDKVDLKEGENNLGNVVMIPKSKLLAEVILKSGSPIRIKGDTTVYTADSFKVRPGANVEELLRRLPGIQVDKNGQITAMGVKVTKVLVEGEEFFGTDPGIATKNLRADIVKEVEVFDKKSDQAEFTGIDDGIKDKTINLKLKEDKKQGYFGKLEVGGGLDPKLYSNALMANAFKGKRKFAGYGIMSNTGQTNLDWQEAQNYGGGMEGMSSGISDDGGMYVSFTTDADENFWGGRNGIPTNWNGGLHYSNKFNNNKNSLNAGYKFTKVNAPGLTKTFSRQFVEDSSIFTNSITDRFSSNIKHAINLTLESNIDSMNSIKWTTRVNSSKNKTRSDFFSEAFDDDNDPINDSRRLSTNVADNNSVSSTILWKHKFRKLSRTLSVNTDLNWNESKNTGMLYSVNNYYKGFIDTDTVDQENLRNSAGKSVVTRIAYTEPLMKDTYVELSYSFGYYNNENDRVTNGNDGTGKYTERIDSLSNSFVFNRLVNTPGANFRVNKKKYNFSFGTSVGFSHFVQKNITDNERYNYNFVNFFPRANFQYKFKPNETFRFNYNGNTTAPSLEQLQPITVNTDPLNIYIGNPDLDQSFRHSFNMGYNSYNVLKERNIWSNLNLAYTQNAFSQFSIIDPAAGKRTYQTINVNGIFNLNLFSDYGFKIKDTKWRLGVGPVLNYNRNVDYIQNLKTLNIEKNVTKTTSYGARISVSQYVENKYNFHFGPSLTMNHSKASVNENANADYWQLQGWANVEITFLKTFEFRTDAEIQFRQKDPRLSQNNNFTRWNGHLVKRMFKNEFEVTFSVYDILNQNQGYQRNFSSSSFTESFYNTLQRFWQLRLTWNFSKNGKPASF